MPTEQYLHHEKNNNKTSTCNYWWLERSMVKGWATWLPQKALKTLTVTRHHPKTISAEKCSTVFSLPSLDTYSYYFFTVTLEDIFWFWIFLADVVLVSSVGFQKIFVHLVIFQNAPFTVHCSGQAPEKWRLIKFHSTLYETQFIKNSCPCSTFVE